jgi:putative NIF3 family GTP cyclohydrolase 1 type 2
MPANRTRRELYEKHGFVFFQYHSPLDGWPLWGTPRALADALGFDAGKAEWPCRFVPAFDLEPQPARRLALRVKERLGLTGVGVSGDLKRIVSKAALLVGGFGGNWSVSEMARQCGADVMIAGELSDYTVRAATEAGITVIKASHYSTENPAVRRLCEHMEKALNGAVECVFLDCGESWNTYGENL